MEPQLIPPLEPLYVFSSDVCDDDASFDLRQGQFQLLLPIRHRMASRIDAFFELNFYVLHVKQMKIFSKKMKHDCVFWVTTAKLSFKLKKIYFLRQK